jgi:Na+/melibiose symporter-like transporter
VISIAGMAFLPDTPRWYYAKNKFEEGDDVLTRLHDAPLDDPAVADMKAEILASIALEEEEHNKFSLLSLIWDNTDLRAGRRIRISFMILSLQQMMGINLSVYYSTVIFAQVGLSPFLAQLLAAVMNTGFAAGTYFLPFTIERFGRRKVLIWSAFVLTICMIIFVAMIGLPNPTLATQWTAVAAVIVYNFAFGYGWIGVPWLYGPEVRPCSQS